MRIATVDDYQGGQRQNLQIEEQAPVLCVIDIMAHPRLHLVESVRLAAPSIDLRPTRHARLHAMACKIAAYLARILLIMIDGMGSQTL